jgi:hypothetical protein
MRMTGGRRESLTLEQNCGVREFLTITKLLLYQERVGRNVEISAMDLASLQL